MSAILLASKIRKNRFNYESIFFLCHIFPTCHLHQTYMANEKNCHICLNCNGLIRAMDLKFACAIYATFTIAIYGI